MANAVLKASLKRGDRIILICKFPFLKFFLSFLKSFLTQPIALP